MEREIRVLSAGIVTSFFSALEQDLEKDRISDMKRTVKASQMSPGSIERKGLGSWVVGSQTSLGKYVVLQGKDGAWSCTCADHKNRLVACKHIRLVQSTETEQTQKSCERCGGEVALSKSLCAFCEKVEMDRIY